MSAMPDQPPATEPRQYTCGALKYTTFGLIMLFVWLLWGDFIWTLLDGSVPGILPSRTDPPLTKARSIALASFMKAQKQVAA